MLRNSEHHTKISHFLTENSIKWTFIPLQSPHIGGLWEAVIKASKTHLRKIIGKIIGTTPLTFEELYTLLARIEACLNSRPLCPMSNDGTDLTVLTPGHFLIGVPSPINRLTRHQLLIQMQQHFWNRWSQEYLTQLQQRSKWNKVSNANVKVGTMVLLRHDNTSPLQWPLGRITSVYPGKDGLIRIVDVKTTSEIL